MSIGGGKRRDHRLHPQLASVGGNCNALASARVSITKTSRHAGTTSCAHRVFMLDYTELPQQAPGLACSKHSRPESQWEDDSVCHTVQSAQRLEIGGKPNCKSRKKRSALPEPTHVLVDAHCFARRKALSLLPSCSPATDESNGIGTTCLDTSTHVFARHRLKLALEACQALHAHCHVLCETRCSTTPSRPCSMKNDLLGWKEGDSVRRLCQQDGGMGRR